MTTSITGNTKLKFSGTSTLNVGTLNYTAIGDGEAVSFLIVDPTIQINPITAKCFVVPRKGIITDLEI